MTKLKNLHFCSDLPNRKCVKLQENCLWSAPLFDKQDVTVQNIQSHSHQKAAQRLLEKFSPWPARHWFLFLFTVPSSSSLYRNLRDKQIQMIGDESTVVAGLQQPRPPGSSSFIYNSLSAAAILALQTAFTQGFWHLPKLDNQQLFCVGGRSLRWRLDGGWRSPWWAPLLAGAVILAACVSVGRCPAGASLLSAMWHGVGLRARLCLQGTKCTHTLTDVCYMLHQSHVYRLTHVTWQQAFIHAEVLTAHWESHTHTHTHRAGRHSVRCECVSLTERLHTP